MVMAYAVDELSEQWGPNAGAHLDVADVSASLAEILSKRLADLVFSQR